jgi:HK97 gp10 family phage protein
MKKSGIVEVGHPLFEKAVNKFERHIRNEVKRIVAETAEMAVAQMKALVPVDDGNLKRSIDVQYLKGGLTAFIIVTAHYGIYIEYGTGIYAEDGNGRKTGWAWKNDKGEWVWTSGMRAQPYFHPSMEMAMKHFTTELNKIGA